MALFTAPCALWDAYLAKFKLTVDLVSAHTLSAAKASVKPDGVAATLVLAAAVSAVRSDGCNREISIVVL